MREIFVRKLETLLVAEFDLAAEFGNLKKQAQEPVNAFVRTQRFAAKFGAEGVFGFFTEAENLQDGERGEIGAAFEQRESLGGIEFGHRGARGGDAGHETRDDFELNARGIRG